MLSILEYLTRKVFSDCFWILLPFQPIFSLSDWVSISCIEQAKHANMYITLRELQLRFISISFWLHQALVNSKFIVIQGKHETLFEIVVIVWIAGPMFIESETVVPRSLCSFLIGGVFLLDQSKPFHCRGALPWCWLHQTFVPNTTPGFSLTNEGWFPLK